ncbi:MAG: acetyl-CoA C-acetyltransferase [Gemmatimonadales bacterium]|nr:acetyl-CoA C-acetyltransferase [Gemmatimonadales bacterium]
MTDVVILAAVRTGFGAFGGALKHLSATDLGVIAARAALARSGVPVADIGHVIAGNVQQTSADASYLARHVGLKAGVPVEVPAVTVNRLCGSGFEAVIQGAQRIRLGEVRAVLAVGTESMSQAPHVVRGARWGLRFAAETPFEDTLWEGLKDRHCGLPMGVTAERLGAQYGITREQADAWALQSQQRAAAAWRDGAFADEVVPVMLPDRKTKQDVPWAMDEGIRADSTAEGLARLAPVFEKAGLVTAGNASGISDGAAALVLADARYAAELGLVPLARIAAWGVAGVPPEIMGIGPAPAARQALARAGKALADMALVEVNEAFAAQYLAVAKELDLDPARTNVHGGAIALGHPLGASGARITAHLVHALARQGGGWALGSACIGGGQGIAVVLEVGQAGQRASGQEAREAGKRAGGQEASLASGPPAARPAAMPAADLRSLIESLKLDALRSGGWQPPADAP